MKVALLDLCNLSLDSCHGCLSSVGHVRNRLLIVYCNVLNCVVVFLVKTVELLGVNKSWDRQGLREDHLASVSIIAIWCVCVVAFHKVECENTVMVWEFIAEKLQFWWICRTVDATIFDCQIKSVFCGEKEILIKILRRAFSNFMLNFNDVSLFWPIFKSLIKRSNCTLLLLFKIPKCLHKFKTRYALEIWDVL